MATIKRSEVEHLRRIEKDYYSAFDLVTVDKLESARDYWLNESWDWEQAAIKASVRNQDLKDKLWAAEQEIHDLKHDLEREKNENDRVTDEWEQLVAGQDKDINDLSNWVIDLLQEPTVIDPPACLKPKDALNYVSQLVHYEPNTATPLPSSPWTVSTFGY